MSNEIVTVQHQAGLMPALSIENAISRYNAVVEFTRRVMKENKDYGIIPGTGDKPTLLKPGAEKLCSLFALAPEFVIVDKIVDYDKGLFYFQYRCDLFRNGERVASGLGSCNSKEKKYRYRNVSENKATDDDKARAIRIEERRGQYGAYRVYVIENNEPFDLVNTIDKMAQKRALIAATLIAANASEFFTQDIEDIASEIVDGEYTESAPAKSKPKPRAKSNGSNWNPVMVLVDAGICEDTFSSSGLINNHVPKDIINDKNVDELLAWATHYRGYRDGGASVEDAATLATDDWNAA